MNQVPYSFEATFSYRKRVPLLGTRNSPSTMRKVRGIHAASDRLSERHLRSHSNSSDAFGHAVAEAE